MFDDEERPRKPAYKLEDSLEGLSVAELEDVISRLDEEKARVMAELEKKRASSAAAEAFFRK